MLYELNIGGDIEQEAIDNGFSLRQNIEATSCEKAISILMEKAPPRARVLWVRDENQRLLMYDNFEDPGYEFELDRAELQKTFQTVLPKWPAKINVSEKQWCGTDGCFIPNLSQVWREMEDRFETIDSEGVLTIESELAGIVVWFVFGILHDRAKKADQFVYTQDINFHEIELCVKRDFLGWANEKPCKKWLNEH